MFYCDCRTCKHYDGHECRAIRQEIVLEEVNILVAEGEDDAVIVNFIPPDGGWGFCCSRWE